MLLFYRHKEAEKGLSSKQLSRQLNNKTGRSMSGLSVGKGKIPVALHRGRIVLPSGGRIGGLVRIAHGVGHQPDIDAAIIGTALLGLV